MFKDVPKFLKFLFGFTSVFTFIFVSWQSAASERTEDIQISLQLDSLYSKEMTSQRALIVGDFSLQTSDFRGFLSTDFEKESLGIQNPIRRINSYPKIREAYAETESHNLFVRVGRQPLRWSEMWILPSLDPWTARNWNHLLYDPFQFQLLHSTGISVTYVNGTTSLDLVSVLENRNDQFPEPLQEEPTPNGSSPYSEKAGGLRLQHEWQGLKVGHIYASKPKENVFGTTVSYAFDFAVPKLEMRHDEDKTKAFVAFGADFFYEDLTVLLQAVRQNFRESWFLQATYDNRNYKFEIQNFCSLNQFLNLHESLDQQLSQRFTNIVLTRYLNKYFSLAAFHTQFKAQEAGLFRIYNEFLGGPAFGLRLNMDIKI